MKSRFLALIGAGLAILVAGCSAEEMAALNAQLAAAGTQGAQASTAVTTVTSTTQSINSTVQTVQTVTDMASDLSDMSSSGDSLASSSSTATTSSATNSGSLMGGVRGAPLRQTTSTTTTTTTTCDPTKMQCPPPPCDPTKTQCPPPPTGTTTTATTCDPTKTQCPPPPTGTTTGTTTTQPVQPPKPPEPPDPEKVCVTAPPAGSFIPCFCVFQKPQVFVDKGAVTCEEHRPPAPGETNFQKTTGTISVTKDDATDPNTCLSVSFSISGIPAEAQVGDEMKKNCEVSGTTMKCSLSMNVCPVTAKCKDGNTKTFYNPAPKQQSGPPTLPGRFQFPAGLEPPADFTKDNKAETEAWLRKLVDTFEANKDEGKLRDLLKTFVTKEPGWITMVNVDRCNNEKPANACPKDMDPNAPSTVKATMIQFGTNQLPPPVCPGEPGPTMPPLMLNYRAGFFSSTVEGKVPGIGQVSMKVFGAEFEKASDKACTPVKLDGTTPVSDTVKEKGREIHGRRAEIGDKGDYFAAGKTTRCQALEAVAAASTAGAEQTPPVTYMSETRNDIRQVPKPQANKEGKLPQRFPVLMKEETKMFLTIKPQGLRGKAGDYDKKDLPPVPQAKPGQPGPNVGPVGPATPPPPPPAPVVGPGPGTPPPPAAEASEVRYAEQRPGGDQTRSGSGSTGPGVQPGQQGQGPGGQGAPGPGQMMAGCPGVGAGQRTEVITFNDGKDETRVQAFVKKEGQCRPTPVDKDGNPIDLQEDEKGNLKTKVKDDAGQEIDVTVANPDAANKTVELKAGFVNGKITFHPADENGITGEGELKVKAFDIEVEVTILLTESGWQSVRGKAGTTDGKTVAFWQERTSFDGADGATIQFGLFALAPGGVKVAAAVDTTGAEAAGSMNIVVPGTTDTNDCENTGKGTIKLLTGSEINTELSISSFEDGSAIVTTKDGTIANEPLSGCAAKAAPTSKATSASTTGQTQSGGQATTTGGTTTKTAAYTY